MTFIRLAVFLCGSFDLLICVDYMTEVTRKRNNKTILNCTASEIQYLICRNYDPSCKSKVRLQFTWTRAYCNIKQGTYYRQLGRSELTRSVWSNSMQKFSTGVTFGQLSWFSWNKPIISFFLSKKENNEKKNTWLRIALAATSYTTNLPPSKRRKIYQNLVIAKCSLLFRIWDIQTFVFFHCKKKKQ